MGLANKISIGRILLVPGIVAALLYYSPDRDWLRFVASGLFFLGILSDAVDGFIARTQNQRSELGTILDPTADKCLILGSIISLSTIRGLPEWMKIPAWFNLVVISRDALLVVGTIFIFILKGKVAVQPNYLGKCTIVAQMLVVPTVLLNLPWKMPLLVFAAGMTVLSAITYIRLGTKALG